MVICKDCGRTIESKFYFCPWCGKSRTTREDDESFELLYKKYIEVQKNSQRNRLEHMEAQLNELEKDLSVLVLSAEMAK